jgi:glycosyltransferase involved in cell wall biosynthesis
VNWPEDFFALTRSSSLLPKRLDPFQASADFNNLTSRSRAVKIASAVSLAFFFKDAIKLAAHADAICSHWMLPSGMIGALLSRALRKPHVVIEHSGALHLLSKMRGGASLARFIIDGSHRVVTVSEDLKRKLIALCPDAESKVEVIPMGICAASQDMFRAQKASVVERPFTVLFIGRLTEVKGVDVLLKAMRGLDGAQLIIAGEGDQRYELEALARALPVSAKFLGRVEAARRDDLLSLSDAVVIPSRVLKDGRTEGTPVVCLEAMAAGRPVIASRAGGLSELIIDGHNGLLFETGNHRMLRERLKLFFGDAALHQKLSKNARLTAASYSWSQAGARFMEIIKGSLKNASL